MPPDPRSLGVWPAFLAASRAWFRLAPVLLILFGAVVLPLYALLGFAAPVVTGAMLGQVPTEVPAREWIVLAGIFLLYAITGGLAAIAGARLADIALEGAPPADERGMVDSVLGRVPAVFATYGLVFLLLTAPILPVAWLVWSVSTNANAGVATTVIALVFAVILLVAFPFLIAAGMYLRLGPILAAVRGRPPLRALRESFELVRGRWWRVCGYVVLATLPSQAVMSGILPVATVLGRLSVVAGACLYGLGMMVFVSFSVVQEVSLLRLLEAARARDRARLGPDREAGEAEALPVA
jgi:hypothetical protein